MNEILKLIEQLDNNSKKRVLQLFSKQEELLFVMQEDKFELLENVHVILLKNRELNQTILELKQKIGEFEIADILQIKQEEWQKKCEELASDLQNTKEALHNEQNARSALEEELNGYKMKCLQIEQECSNLKNEVSTVRMASERFMQENELLNAQVQELRGSLDSFVDLLTL